MRINRISGRNLASLAGDFEVDLATGPLAHAGVFAIAGPTGAGKSTLLDAICLALFNQTPRLGAKSSFEVPDIGEERIGAIDVRHLLRRGRAEGFAEVEFEGRDQRRWVARWEVRRARAKRGADGRLQDVELSLREVGAPTAVAGGKKEVLDAIKAALGLDFDQFRRSVLLAQGDFAAFLRARSDERSALLENMTGTSIYSRISAEVFRRAREAAAVTERLRERLSATRALEPEVRASLHARLVEIIAARAAASERESTFNQILGWWREQQKLLEALTAAGARLSQAEAARDHAAPRRAALAELKRLAPLRAPRDALRAAADALARATEGAQIRAEQARQASEAVAAMTELVVQARAAERGADERAEALRPVLRDAAALDGEIAGRQAAAAAASQAHVDATQRLNALQRQAKRLTDLRDAAIAQRDRAQRQLDEHPALIALIPSWTHSRSVLDRALGEAAAASKGDADARRQMEAVDAARRAREERAGVVAAANTRLISAEARARQAQAALLELPEAPLVRRAAVLDAIADDLRWRASTHERWSDSEAARRRHQDEAVRADCVAEGYDREAGEIAAGLQELALDLQAAERLADRLALAPLRERLVDGEPCPLCGATHHPGHPDADEAPPDDLCARLRRQQQQDTGRRDAALARADAAREQAVRAREAATNAAAPLAALVAEWSARPHLPLSEPEVGGAPAHGAGAEDTAVMDDGAPRYASTTVGTAQVTARADGVSHAASTADGSPREASTVDRSPRDASAVDGSGRDASTADGSSRDASTADGSSRDASTSVGTAHAAPTADGYVSTADGAPRVASTADGSSRDASTVVGTAHAAPTADESPRDVSTTDGASRDASTADGAPRDATMVAGTAHAASPSGGTAHTAPPSTASTGGPRDSAGGAGALQTTLPLFAWAARPHEGGRAASPAAATPDSLAWGSAPPGEAAADRAPGSASHLSAAGAAGPIDAPAPPLHDGATAGWLAARADAVEAARAALAARRDARTRAMDASDAAQIAERDARRAATDAERALRVAESAVVDAERAAQRAADLANGARERLEVGIGALGPVLTALPDAESRLRSVDRALVVELDARLRELRTVQGELQAQSDAAQRAMNELTAAEGGLPELIDAVRRADEASLAAAESKREAVERRQGLLDGRPIAEVERELQREVRAAAHNRETSERNLGQTEQRASTLQGQADAAAQAALQAGVDHQAATDLLDASLREYGVSTEALERALTTTPAWAEAEARALAGLDDDVARATGAREASRAALDVHGQPPEVDAARTQEALAEASATVQSLDTERGALDQQLRDDDALRAAATGIEADLHRAMEHEDRAARLNALIGSADGKRFRTFAQSLTLEALLLAANEHLSTLAPRYRLRRAEVAREPLELLVVDRDLADELRPVASLSGGETFLVSLALALGLSSLASDRLRIDSLFIDEGFGTLDPETLEVALSTLDALQSEGRQVGIISHVQGIGERIGARVLVERVGGGASRVRVVVG